MENISHDTSYESNEDSKTPNRFINTSDIISMVLFDVV